MQTQKEYPLGPVEYLAVRFEGNQFRGEIVPALNELIDSGMIRVIDLAVVSKDEAGSVTIFEASELPGDLAAALEILDLELPGMLSEEDLMMVANDLPPNCTAATLLFDNVWAARFARAIRDANGEVLLNVRIPHAVVRDAKATLIEAAGL